MVLGILGSGGLGREVLQIAKELNAWLDTYNDIFFVDDYTKKTEVNGCIVKKYNDIIKEYTPDDLRFVIALGEPEKRKLNAEQVEKDGYKLAILVHPSVNVPNDTIIEDGVVICRLSYISLNMHIKKNSYIQPLASLGHDSIIGENCVISSNSTISGNCKIGNNTYVAINSCIKQGLSIGKNCIIGMGAAVTSDVEDNMILAPATIRKVPRKKGSKVFG